MLTRLCRLNHVDYTEKKYISEICQAICGGIGRLLNCKISSNTRGAEAGKHSGPVCSGEKTKLLSAVGNQIDAHPAMFQNLLQALRKQTPLKEVVDDLEGIYKDYGRWGLVLQEDTEGRSILV